ncbi:sugar ABC transporter permease [Clostridia bacterium]|nr:sugar ABC transporter permease [Clostridia bacterium]
MVSRKAAVTQGDKIFYALCYLISGALALMVLYPLVYVLSASISSASSVLSGRMLLFPVELDFSGYKYVLQYRSIWIGYRNTLIYTVSSTLLGIAITMVCAYPLARKNLAGRRIFTLIFTFTMIFSGGMIPNYLLIKNLRLLNTPWVMIIPGCMSVYNLIVTRTFIQSNIADELLEAARIDGCSDTYFFLRIVLPLSKTICAVLAIQYAAAHWNAYFNAFLYLNSKELYPLQIFLRQILIQSNFETDQLDPEAVARMQTIRQSMQYAIIVISTAPMLCMYPFAQKYFVKGMMIGSVKG